MNSSKILEIKNLHKLFGAFKAVNNISLHVNKGDIYGFLGPNGAGKSTTLRMVLGLIKPSKGNIFINNENISGNNRKFLNDIGALIEKPDFYKNLSALDNLKILHKMSRLKNDQKIFEVLNEVDLWDKLKKFVATGDFTLSFCASRTSALFDLPRGRGPAIGARVDAAIPRP